MEVMSYRKIAQELQKESPHLRINSPQTARNICIRALKKIKFIIEDRYKKETSNFKKEIENEFIRLYFG